MNEGVTDNGERESERSRECRFRFQNITHFPPQHVIMGCLGNENNKRVRDVGGYTKMFFSDGNAEDVSRTNRLNAEVHSRFGPLQSHLLLSNQA